MLMVTFHPGQIGPTRRKYVLSPIRPQSWARAGQGNPTPGGQGKTPGRGCPARIRGPGEGCCQGQGAAPGYPWAGAAVGLDFGADSRPCVHNILELLT